MIGLKEAAGLVASAILFVSSIMVPAGDHSVVAVDSVEGAGTEAVANGPVPVRVADLTVYDPVLSDGSSVAPTTYEGAVERVTAVAATDQPGTLISFGDERLEVPRGSTITIQHVAGTVSLEEADQGSVLDVEGTATDVRIEPPTNPVVSTSETAGGIPVSSVSADGRELTPGYEDAGAYDELELQVAEDATDVALGVSNGVFPVEANQKIVVEDYVGLIAYAAIDGEHAELRLQGFANVTIGEKTIDKEIEVEANVSLGDTLPRTGAPRASFTFAPEEVQTGETVSFRDTSEAELAIVHREWNFDDGETSHAKNPDHNFPAPGFYDVSLTVKDANGRTNTTVKTVQVVNTAPEVDITWEPLTPKETHTVEFRAEIQDRDSNVGSVEWSFSDGKTFTGATVTRSFAALGSYDVTVSVTDEKGAEDTAAATVHVENAPPDADFRVEPELPVAGQPATLVSTSTTVGTGQLVNWTWRIDGVAEVRYGEEVDLEFATSGRIGVQLTVRDSNGGQTTINKIVEVDPAPPDVNIKVDPVYPNPGETVTFTAQVDTEGKPTSAEWTFSDGETAAGLTVERTFKAGGSFTASVTVEDTNNLTGTATTSFDVNHRPDAQIEVVGEGVGVQQTAVLTFDTLELEAVVSDDDGNDTSLRWFVGTTKADASARCDVGGTEGDLLDCSWPDDGQAKIQLVVEDDNDAQTTATLKVIVLNRKPTLNPSAPNVVNLDEEVSIPSGADDADGNVTDVRWFLDGQLIGESTILVHTFAEAGTQKIVVEATDDDGAKTSENVTVHVNRPPSVDADASPTTVEVGEVVDFSASATDPDGDDAQLSFAWSFGDGHTASGASVSHAYSVQGTFVATVTVTDEDGGTATAEVEIDVNAQPLNARIEVDPAQPQAGDNVTLTVVFDGDRDVHEIEWNIGGETRITNDATLVFQFDQAIHVFITAVLTTEDGATDQASLELRVTGDTSHSVIIEPELPDGQCPHLLSSEVDIRFTNLETLHTVGIDSGQADWTIDASTCVLSASFAAGTWSVGDGYELEGEVAGSVTADVGDFQLDATIHRDFLLRNAPILIEDVAVVERSHEPLVFAGAESQTTYHDPLEPVNVRGLVEWGDGTPVDTWDIHFDIAYHGPDDLLGAASIEYRSWVKATGEAGVFNVTAPAPVLSARAEDVSFAEPEDTSFVYLPGRYTVDVTASTSAKADGGRVEFVEDPEGIFAQLEGSA